MLTYLIPILIASTGGKMVGGDRGRVVGAIAVIGAIMSDTILFNFSFGIHPVSINNAARKPNAIKAPIFGMTIPDKNLPNCCTLFFTIYLPITSYTAPQWEIYTLSAINKQ